MKQGGPPVYTLRGARPRPAPTRAPASNAWRGPVLLIVVMVGWLFLVLGLAAIAAPAGSGASGVVHVGRGVTFTNPGGWTAAPDTWPVGPNPVSLQKAGASVTFAAAAYSGTNQQLLDDRTRWLESRFASLRALPPTSNTIAGDLPALQILFSGTANSSRLEGEMVVAVRSGTGVVMFAVAPAGQLRQVQGDLDDMLNSMVVPQ